MTSALSTAALVVVSTALGCLALLAAAAVAGSLRRGGRRTPAIDGQPALAVSRFTIPVSVIVPADDLAGLPRGLMNALQNQEYPEFEVILVTSEARGDELEALTHHWRMRPKEIFYRRTLQAAPVKRIFVSGRDARFLLVQTEFGGRAAALNCGANLARFRYVVTLPPGLQVEADTLVRLMAPALRDPGAVLAVTAHGERTGRQRLASVREWLVSQLWGSVLAGLPPRDAVIAWRRDALIEAGGFAASVLDPELDLAVRLDASAPRGRVVRAPDVVGGFEPLPAAAAAQAVRRHRRALVAALRMLGRHAHGIRSAVRLGPIIAMSLLLPMAQVAVLGLLAAEAAVGWVSWTAPVAGLLLLVFGGACVSSSALLLRGGAPGAPSGVELRRLLLRGPGEALRSLIPNP